MKLRLAAVLGVSLLSMNGWAWGPATHAYIASCVTESENYSVLFGSMLPDCTGIILDNATEKSQFNHMTHFEPERLATSAMATGFKTHNGSWGGDYYAHLYYTTGAPDIWSTIKYRQLSTEFGITMQNAEDVIEMCVDIQVRLLKGPSWGTLITAAANASGAAHEQAMVDAYAAELAARVSGLSVAEAEQDIRNAVQGFKMITATFGQQLQGSATEIRTAVLPLLATYLGCTTTVAGTYYDRGMEITADFQTELDRACAEIKLLMPGAVEGEGEGEGGEGEGEGEGDSTTVVDFCDAFQQVVDNPLLQGLDPQFAQFIALLDPASADLNGAFSVDDSSGSLSISVSGNGILDAANELALLERILNNPTFRGSTVLDHDLVLAAWETNVAQLDTDIGPLAAALGAMAPGLKEILVGFVTLGDGAYTATSLPTEAQPTLPIIVSGTGSFGLVAALFATVNEMIREELGAGFDNPNLDRNDYVTMDALLPGNDADGDGASNAAEYAYFTPASCAKKKSAAKSNDPTTFYPVAALNYRICPACGQSCPECTPTSGLYAAGQSACLHVPGTFPVGTAFDWSKEGLGPLFGARYVGLDCQTLQIEMLAPGDSGVYVCTYGPNETTWRVYVTVGETLPVGPGGIAFLLPALAMGVLGARRFRAQK